MKLGWVFPKWTKIRLASSLSWISFRNKARINDFVYVVRSVSVSNMSNIKTGRPSFDDLPLVYLVTEGVAASGLGMENIMSGDEPPEVML